MMFESVLNPLAWWGLAAVSVPIIIHLINRLRYKKVQWAAMEFLLQAMQRHKRKLILEQLLLLLLRCLLILLVVLLIVRPTWFLGGEGNQAGSIHHHVFLLDDSFSMQDLDDSRRPDGPSAFGRATQLLADLAQAHAASSANHHWTVLTWSHPQAPEYGAALGSEAAVGSPMTADEAGRLREQLGRLEATYLPLSPLPALRQALGHLEAAKEGRKVLHIVSDFRAASWLGAGDEMYTILADLSRQGKVRIQLHDLALPARSANAAETPPGHANLAVVSLVPRPRRTAETLSAMRSDLDAPLTVVTPRLPFDVHVAVRNFGAGEMGKVRLVLRSDGLVKAERIIERLAGGEERKIVLNLEYPAEEPAGLKALSAVLDDPDGRDHLSGDDIRFGYIELRPSVSVLLIDPDARHSEAASDSLFVAAALTGSARTGIKTDVITPRELSARKNLAGYSAIYLLNISGVGRSEGDLDEEGLRQIERYARAGGSVAFFLGPRTNVTSFNEKLYQKGSGIFPVPLMAKPDPEGRKSLTYIDDEPDREDVSTKLRFLKPHPAFPFSGDAADTLSKYIHINRYFRVDSTTVPKSGPDAASPNPGSGSGREEKSATNQSSARPAPVEVLVQITDRRPLAFYRDEAKRLADELAAVAGEVPEGKLARFAGLIHQAVQDAENKKARKGELIEALAGALGEPAAAAFWKEGRHAELQRRFRVFLDQLQQGDPLALEGAVSGGPKAGHVFVFLSPASPTLIAGRNYGWNDMAQGDLGQFFFVPMMLGLQEHLASRSRASELSTSALIQSQPLEMRLDPERYNPQVELWYQPGSGAAGARLSSDATGQPPTFPPHQAGERGGVGEGRRVVPPRRDSEPGASLASVKVDTINAERVKALYEQQVPPGGKPTDNFDWLIRIKPIEGPGHYRLKFNQVGAAGPAPRPSSPQQPPRSYESGLDLDTAKIPHERPLAFNIDGDLEGDLARISEDAFRDSLADGLQKGSGKTPLAEAREYVQTRNWFVQSALEAQANEALQTQSWSDYSWIILAFVGLLLLEQYLAMKFSHHIT
jgi:hypothetical protein